MKKYLKFLFLVALLSELHLGAAAETERSALLNHLHTASWTYYTDPSISRWYISQIDGYKMVDVYSLGPLNSGSASWWTVGKDVASIIFGKNQVVVNKNLDTDPSDYFDDAGLMIRVKDHQIHSDRIKIQGQTVQMKWYFFQAPNNNWYIVNSPEYSSYTNVYRFGSENNKYNWGETETNDLVAIFKDLSGGVKKIYFGFKDGLKHKGFENINHDEMLKRYKNNYDYYSKNKSFFDLKFNDGKTFFLSLITSFHVAYQKILYGNSLYDVSDGFALAGCWSAQNALRNFLFGKGENINIDIESNIREGKVNKLVYGSILDGIKSGITSGEVTIEQKDWGGLDQRLTFGGLKIDWESDGLNVILYVNAIYSFDITDISIGRPTIAYYKLANDLVQAETASDFYFTGRSPLIPLDQVRIRAQE